MKHMKTAKIKAIITALSAIFFIIYGVRYFILKPSAVSFDLAASLLIFLVYLVYFKQLNQDETSYFFVAFSLILHNLGLYGTSILGLPFDHYMHFAGGFTFALVIDRLLLEKIPVLKKAALVIIAAVGVGAVAEIVEWGGYALLGSGEGFFLYGVGDEGEWQNTILDMFFNLLGASVLMSIVWFRKSRR